MTAAFPAEAYLGLLEQAQALLDTGPAREDLLRNLGVSVRASEAARAPGEALPSAASFAAALVDRLAAAETLDPAIAIVRRIVSALPRQEASARALIEVLETVQRGRGVEEVAAGRSPDLAGYRRWLGFDCTHEYSLAENFVGRAAQLADLDAWMAGPPDGPVVYCLSALGGGGKSALAWHWLDQRLPDIRQRQFRGAFWGSFYEKDFGFDRFLRRLLRFAGQIADEEVDTMARPALEDRLLETLREHPFLVVLDGLERLMNGYAVVFDRAVDPDSAGTGKRPEVLTQYDRQLTDLRDGAFLRRLAAPMASRLLITSRLTPADLERRERADPLPLVRVVDLGGLEQNDLEKLWKNILPNCPLNDDAFALLSLSGFHPLVTAILARSVARAGANWLRWVDSHPGFHPPSGAGEAEARAHLIGVCLGDLSEPSLDVLGVLTTSGKPMPLALIAQILVRGSEESGDGRWSSPEEVARELDQLIGRGLVGLSARANPAEYDVHPVVRGATWRVITDARRDRLFTNTLSEFLATPDQRAPDEGLDLNRATSLLRLLVQAKEIDRAWEMFQGKLYGPLSLLNDNRTLRDLFEVLLPGGDVYKLLPLRSRAEQGNATGALGSLLMEAGDAQRADKLLRWTGAIRLQVADYLGFLEARQSRTWQTLYQGKLFDTELTLREMKLQALRASALEVVPGMDAWIGLVLALRGRDGEARRRFEGSNLGNPRWWIQTEAEAWVYAGQPAQALAVLDRLNAVPWQPADGVIERAWEELTRGMALYHRGDHDGAWQHLVDSLQAAARTDYRVIQCFALPYLAEIQLAKGDTGEAAERLHRYRELDPDDAYQLCAADARRVEALCKLRAGDREGALASATRAYQLAACDGPPFTHAAALERARRTLEACGGFAPDVSSRVDPRWRQLLSAQAQEERELALGLERATRQRPAPASLNRAEARELLLEPRGSEEGLRWWRATTADFPAGARSAFVRALDARGIELDRFRAAFEASDHRSLVVTFYQLHAEVLLHPDQPRPVGGLAAADQQRWLTDVDWIRRTVEDFLTADDAQAVWAQFEIHRLDRDGIAAFLDDNRRRLIKEGALARAWWEGVEKTCALEHLLTLSQCLVFAETPLDKVVEEIAAGSDRGLRYAFVVLQTNRHRRRLSVEEISKTEGWTDLEVHLRLHDIKMQIASDDASPEAQRLWRSLQEKNGPRKILQLAEELARRRATVEDYFQAFVFSHSESIPTNLAYVDYASLKNTKWDPAGPWPTIAAVYGVTSHFPDTSSWTEERRLSRLRALLERVRADEASAEVGAWWERLGGSLPTSVRLRIVEEMTARQALLEDLYRAVVDGGTENVPAAIAYWEVKRETTSAAQRALTLNLEGNRLYQSGDYASAIPSYEAAIRETPRNPVFYSNLVAAWRARKEISPAEIDAKVEAALARGAEACPDGALVGDLGRVRARIRLAALGGLPSSPSERFVPLVTPIAVELASDLVAPYKGPDSAAMADFKRLGEVFREQTGFKIPGIRARENPGLPASQYVVLIDEVMRSTDSIVAGREFVKPPRSELEAVGREHPLVVDPVDGAPGVWLPATEAAAMRPRWDATAYLSRRLEALLRQRMHILIGTVEVLERLGDSWAGVARRIAADPVVLSAFTRTVQALLREQVPTAAWEWICTAFQAEWTRTPNVDQVVAALRQQPELRGKLPANSSPLSLWRLGAELEAALSASLTPYGDRFVLALEPRVLHAVMSAVRSANDESPATLVTRDPLVRPYLRQVVETEFPRLPVMAEAELDASRPSADGRIIELPDVGAQP